MASEPIHRVSVEEYLALERRSEAKSEYLNGEIFAMAGASRLHNLLLAHLPSIGCTLTLRDVYDRVIQPSIATPS